MYSDKTASVATRCRCLIGSWIVQNETKEEGRKIGERDTSSACEYLVYVRLGPWCHSPRQTRTRRGGFDKSYTGRVTCRAYSPLSPTLFRSKTIDFTWVEAKKQEGLYLDLYFYADSDRAFHTKADLDPNPASTIMRIRIRNPEYKV